NRRASAGFRFRDILRFRTWNAHLTDIVLGWFCLSRLGGSLTSWESSVELENGLHSIVRARVGFQPTPKKEEIYVSRWRRGSDSDIFQLVSALKVPDFTG